MKNDSVLYRAKKGLNYTSGTISHAIYQVLKEQYSYAMPLQFYGLLKFRYRCIHLKVDRKTP